MTEQQLIKKFMQTGKVPGVSVGIIQENDVDFFNFGKIKSKSKLAPNENTIFEIASISKTFTSILMELLQKEGKLDRNDCVSKYIPEFSKPELEKITLNHLATHTSGLPNIPIKFIFTNLLATLKSKNTYGSLPNYSSRDMIEYFAKSKPKSVGTTWSYSNGGMGLLGNILEKITGTGYEDLVKDKICSTLDMQDTGIVMSKYPKDRIATGHSYFGKPSEYWSSPALEGAVGLFSTVNDLIKFLQGNLGLVECDIFSELKSCQDTRFVPKMSFLMKKIMFPYLGVKFDEMALGWMIIRNSDDVLFYDGGTAAFSSFIGIIPNKKRGVVVLANKLSKLTHKLGMDLLFL